MGKNIEDAKKEYDEIKTFTSTIPVKDFKSGGWFFKLLKYSLDIYSKKATDKYFQNKYKGLNPDAIVDRRIALAKNYAGVAGFTATSAYTVAIAATIGTKGGASPYALPAGALSLLADLTYVSHLQLRLAYDISVLYGSPLDYTDPEDLHVLLVLAFGIKAGEIFSNSITRATPEGIRIIIKMFIKKDTLKWLQALPYVGRYLLQRNLIKAGIPIVGIPLSFLINRIFTGGIGKRAKKLFRIRLAINNVIDNYPLNKISDYILLLEILWICISSDKDSSNEEAWLLKRFVDNIRKLGYSKELEIFSNNVNYEIDKIINNLSQKNDEEKLHYLEAAYMSITVDGYPNDKELKILNLLCNNCDVEYDDIKVNNYMDMFHNN